MSMDPHPDPSDHPGRPLHPDSDVRRERQLLDDCGAVRQTRAELDELTLQVLSSGGLGEAEVGQLRQFLTCDWQHGLLALRRLQDATGGLS